jgi:hypothetical protein
MTMFRLALLTCVLAVFCAASASADPPQSSSAKEAIGTSLLRASYAATFVVQAMDASSTREVVRLGGRELNPLLAPFSNNTAALYGVEAGMAAAYVLSEHSLAKHHKFAAIALATFINSAYILAAQHNRQVVEQMRAQNGR